MKTRILLDQDEILKAVEEYLGKRGYTLHGGRFVIGYSNPDSDGPGAPFAAGFDGEVENKEEDHR